MGFVTIFIVFVGEDWNKVMYYFYRSQGQVAIVFFSILYISLNLTLMNLFLVNVLSNFRDNQELETKNDAED